MSLWKMAASNFKRSMREYFALIVALAFAVFVFFNFQNMVYSESMKVLQNMRKDYIDTVIEAASIVFGIFVFFFIWYATNVFLNQRKKEIGIYTFLGLDNMKIGKLYAIEATCIALASVGLGIVTGIGFSKLFQMAVLKLSDISVNVEFSFSIPAILITAGLFFLFFGIMIGKGYVSIVRSSVRELLFSAREAEMKREHPFVKGGKIVLGVGILGSGYFCAMKTGGINSLQYALAAVILVIAGTYFLFSGVIPLLIRRLTKNKHFLYQKQRTLWVNQLSYRIKKNYRTYAMVTILMICSVTVLAMAIAMKSRYENVVHFRQTYTYQINSIDPLNEEEIAEGISQENEIVYDNKIPYLVLDEYGVVPYSAVKEAANRADLAFPYEELKEDEAIQLSHIIFLSLNLTQDESVRIGETQYQILNKDETAYLGTLQEQVDFYMINDTVYDNLKLNNTEWYLYNYKIKDATNAEASRPYLDTLVNEQDGMHRTGYSVALPENKEETWCKIFYALCIFMFATLILASASIIFIKLNNDAWADKEQYEILKKIGIAKTNLAKSIKWEICFAYYCPFVLMVITSWFSVKALGNVMKQNLISVNIVSTAVIFALFTLICIGSVHVFRKKVL